MRAVATAAVGVLMALAGFAAGYVITVSDGAPEVAAIAGGAALGVATIFAVSLRRDVTFIYCLSGSAVLGCLAGAGLGLGASTPHLAEVGDRTRDTWTEMGWELGVAVGMTALALYGAVVGAGLGFLAFVLRKAGERMGRWTLRRAA